MSKGNHSNFYKNLIKRKSSATFASQSSTEWLRCQKELLLWVKRAVRRHIYTAEDAEKELITRDIRLAAAAVMENPQD